MKRERSNKTKRLVIADAKLISGIKYTGKNLDVSAAHGEGGRSGRQGCGRSKGKMCLTCSESSEGSWPTRERAGAYYSPAVSGYSVY